MSHLLQLLACIPLVFLITDLVPKLQADNPDKSVLVPEAFNDNYVQYLGVNDYKTLMNLTNFRFTKLPHVCNPQNPPFLLVLIQVNPDDIYLRNKVRSFLRNQSDPSFIYMFSAAQAYDPNAKIRMDNEHRLYQDILEGNFEDSYYNMSYKHLMLFKYVLYHCPSVKYVLKMDEDAIVNISRVQQFLYRKFPTSMSVNNLMLCVNKRIGHEVSRDETFKWCVPKEEYAEDVYPPHCPGLILMYSVDVIFRLYVMAQTCNCFLWVDDIFVTGILAEKAAVPISLYEKRPHLNAKDRQVDDWNALFDGNDWMFAFFRN